jgi:hypothetical protein
VLVGGRRRGKERKTKEREREKCCSQRDKREREIERAQESNEINGISVNQPQPATNTLNPVQRERE